MSLPGPPPVVDDASGDPLPHQTHCLSPPPGPQRTRRHSQQGREQPGRGLEDVGTWHDGQSERWGNSLGGCNSVMKTTFNVY